MNLVIQTKNDSISATLMRTSFSVACAFAIVIGTCIGCNATDKEESTKSSLQASAAQIEPNTEKAQYLYMAVCITKEAHEGNEYVLTKWLDSKDKALMYGREHGRKRKGHVIVYRTRAKP